MNSSFSSRQCMAYWDVESVAVHRAMFDFAVREQESHFGSLFEIILMLYILSTKEVCAGKSQ